MDIRAALKRQHHAALKALRLAIEACPPERWDDPADGLAAFWRVAYHTLFYADFYLQDHHESFTPWALHQDEAEATGPIQREGGRPPKPCRAYTRDELLEYCRLCDAKVDERLDAMDLGAPECGFPWYTMPKLEHQLVTIRHIQHHAAALASRLRRESGVAIAWVARA